MRRIAVALVGMMLGAASLVASTAVTSGAVWAPGSTASGTATARSIGVPASVTATALSSSSIRIDWAAPTGGSVTPTQYVVTRNSPSGTVCTVSAPTVTCTDTGRAASTSYGYTVAARIGTDWTSGASAPAAATTSAAPTFKLNASPGQSAGTAFTVTITATTNGTTTDTAYAGAKTITLSGPATAPSGAAPVYPATVNFIGGVGTASVTLVKAEAVTLAATDGTRSGTVPITVAAGAARKLGWTSSSVSCAAGSVVVGTGGAFTSKVTAYDNYLNPRAGSRTVNLSRSPTSGTLNRSSLTITSAVSETTSSFTYTRSNGSSTVVTVTAAASGLTSVTCQVKQN